MMLKAVGFDPQLLLAKGAELEAQGKVLAAELQAKVASIETRISHIEAMLIRIETYLQGQAGTISRLESAAAGIAPAGETFDVEAQIINPEEN